LPRFFEAVFAGGTSVVRLATVMFREPSILAGQCIEMINERLIMFGRMRIEEVTGCKHFGPCGNVIGNHAMSGLR
jgi:hypothetical protein